MRRAAGETPAVARASCPCRFTAKACPERSEGMAVPQLAGKMSTPERAKRPLHRTVAPTWFV